MRSKLFIFLLAIAALIGFASPASADATSDQEWRDLSAQELSYANGLISSLPVASASNPDGDLDLGIPSIAYSWQTLVAADNAGWNFQDPTVQADMNRVLGLYTTNGDGGKAGFLTGQASFHTEILTVTAADHVGPLLLKAAQYDPADYGSWLNKAVDQVMSAPVVRIKNPNTGLYMDCKSYYTDQSYCAVNVALGDADFLNQARAMGYLGTGYTDSDIQTVIDGATQIAQYAFALGTKHWFPYSLNTDGSIVSLGNGCGQTKPRTPEDWNHEAFVMESLMDLGIDNLGDYGSTAKGALDYHLNHHDYNSGEFNGFDLTTGCKSDLDAAADIKGRLRMEYLDPSNVDEDPHNTLIDVNWMLDTWGTKRDDTGQLYHTASNAMQTSLYSLRLAEAGSDTLSDDDSIVQTITQPQKRCADNTYNCDNTTADGATVTIDAFVQDGLGVGIVDKSVDLHYDGGSTALIASKTTGLRGNIAFTYKMPSTSGATKCFNIKSANGTASPKLCLTTR